MQAGGIQDLGEWQYAPRNLATASLISPLLFNFIPAPTCPKGKILWKSWAKVCLNRAYCAPLKAAAAYRVSLRLQAFACAPEIPSQESFSSAYIKKRLAGENRI